MYTLSQNVGNTLGIRWPYAIHTLAIRQLYASCMLNTLLNRPAYAKMSIYVADALQMRCRCVADALQMRCRCVADALQIRCRYVAARYVRHTSEICYSCAINALSWPWWWYHTIYRQYYLVFSVSALVFGWGAQYLPEAEGRGQIRHRGQIQGGYWKHQVMLYLLHTWTVFVRFCL